MKLKKVRGRNNVKMKKTIITSMLVTTLLGATLPTVQAAAAEIHGFNDITEVSKSNSEMNNIPSVVKAFDLYLTGGETSFVLDSKAAEIVTAHDYQIMLNAVENLNTALINKENGKNGDFTTFAAPSMTVYTKYLSNSQANTWAYNLGRVGRTTSLIGLLVSLGVPAGMLVGVAGLSAEGIAEQINYRNRGNGVIMYFRLNGISVRSR